MFYSETEYRAAIRFIAANNPYCGSEDYARERLDVLIHEIATIPLSAINPVTCAGTLGFSLIRIFGSERIDIRVSPSLAESTARGFDWKQDSVST